MSDCESALDAVSPYQEFQVGQYMNLPSLKNGRVPTQSPVFIAWRNRVGPWVPDTVFIEQYTNKENPRDSVRVGRFMEGELVRKYQAKHATPADDLALINEAQLLKFYAANPYVFTFDLKDLSHRLRRSEGMQVAYDVALEKYKSLDNFWRKIKIDPLLSEQEQIQLYDGDIKGGAYAIDGTGKLYFLSLKEIERIQKALEMPFVKHLDLSGLLFGESQELLVLVDYGMVYPRANEAGLDFNSHRKNSWGDAVEPFNTEEYFVHYNDSPSTIGGPLDIVANAIQLDFDLAEYLFGDDEVFVLDEDSPTLP